MSRLEEQLQRNSERRIREGLLDSLPEELAPIFEAASAKYSRVFFDTLNPRSFPRHQDGRLTTTDACELYWHIEYDRLDHVVDQLKEASFRFSPPVAIHLGRGPVYLACREIDSEQATRLLNLLADGQASRLFLADAGSGLIIDSYCGYLPNDRATSRDEVVYEITYYRTAQQAGVLNALAAAADL